MKYTLGDYLIAFVGCCFVILPEVLAKYLFEFIDLIKGGE